MKIICTGNPNSPTNIANSVKKYFPNTTFVHKSNGYDFSTDQGVQQFKDLVQDYDVFINSSYIGPGIQEQLLIAAREVWSKGHVFNIGSTVEYQTFKVDDQTYLESKLSLRNKSMELCRLDFKTTHMIVSGFKDNDPIAKTIDWLLSVDNADFPIIGINDNQLSEEFLKLWDNK